MYRPCLVTRIVASALIFILLLPAAAFAQSPPGDGEADRAAAPELPQARAVLAMTRPDYPVSPGDVYRLSWAQAGELQRTDLIVDSERLVSLGMFGEVDAAGMTFTELRAEVRERVTAQYPGSYPQLVIRSLGEYEVAVRGAASSTRRVRIDGLTRLSSVFERRAADYASERRVVVVDAGGGERAYDLYSARREGDLDEDPYVRPDEAVRFEPAERTATISGRVRRPGEYQLLPGEGVAELVERYAGGLTREADAALWLYDDLASGGIKIYNYVDEPRLTTREMVEIIRDELGRSGPLPRVPLGLIDPPARIFDWIGVRIGRDLPVTAARAFLPAVFPVLLYDGSERWTVPGNVHDLRGIRSIGPLKFCSGVCL